MLIYKVARLFIAVIAFLKPKGIILAEQVTTEEATTHETATATTAITTSTETTAELTTSSQITTKMYPHGAASGDVLLSCDVEQCSSGKLEISPLYVKGFKFKHIQVNTNGYVILGENIYDKTQPTDWRLLFTPTFRDQVRRSGFAILAPLWTDNDSSFPDAAVMYQQYDKNLRFGSRDQSLVSDVLATAQEDVAKYATFQEFTATWAMIVTWKNMYPRQFYDSSKDKSPNSFQLVIIADSLNSRTTILAIYSKTGWDSQDYVRQSQIGWFFIKDDTEESFTSIQANTGDAFTLDSIVFTSTGERGKLASVLTDVVSSTVDYEQKCYNWFWFTASDSQRLASLMEELKGTRPCPCDRSLVLEEIWTFNEDRSPQDGSSSCYYERLPKGQSASECCYDPVTGALVTTEDGSAGHKFLFHPNFNSNHQNEDVLPKFWCCTYSEYCQLYNKLRPVDDCHSYVAPNASWVVGDPHITTLDGLSYTFNGLGEYILLKTDPEVFVLQGRTIQAIDDNKMAIEATIFTAFAAKDFNSDLVQIQVNSARDAHEIFLGTLNLTDWFFSSDSGASYSGEAVTLTKSDATIVKAVFGSGFSISVEYVSQFGGVLYLLTMVPIQYEGDMRGLLGVLNNDINDDLTRPDGAIVAPNATDKDIFYNFGQQWQVSVKESIFFDKNRLPRNVYFVPLFTSDIQLSDVVKTNCQGIHSCVYDSLLTGSTAAGLSTLKATKLFTEIQKNLAHERPRIIGARTWNVTINKTNTLSIDIITDNKDNVTISISLIRGAENINLTFDTDKNMVIWKPVSLAPTEMRLTAHDSYGGVSPQYTPVIRLCSCIHGTCNFDEIHNNQRKDSYFQLAECTCDVGWTGVTCSEDHDVCNTLPCSHGDCVDLSPDEEQLRGFAFVCLNCTEGYRQNNDQTECIDIDECQELIPCSSINALCINTPGSYRCICKPNYQLDSSADECVDIDECVDTPDVCTQTCENTEGSYYCTCLYGYHLDSDEKTCIEDSDLCALSSLRCSHACILDADPVRCFCPAGFELDIDDQTCVDIDECALGLHHCSDRCVNTPGYYRCSCDVGYVLHHDGKGCQRCPHNKWGEGCSMWCNCADVSTPCLASIGCVKCPAGFLDRGDCSDDIDECLKDPCDEHSVCHNTIGSFKCICQPGYRLINTTHCSEVNECQSDPCADHGVCRDVFNGFQCQCTPGFTGLTCELDIDECLSNPCVNGGTCQNRVNRYSCLCSSSWMGASCEVPLDYLCRISFSDSDVVFTYDVTLRITNIKYNARQEVANSSEYLTLLDIVQHEMEYLFGCNQLFKDILVGLHHFKFSEGIMVDFRLYLAEERTEEEITFAILNPSQDHGFRLQIDPGSLEVNVHSTDHNVPTWMISLISLTTLFIITIVTLVMIRCTMVRQQPAMEFETGRVEALWPSFTGEMPTRSWLPFGLPFNRLWSREGQSMRTLPQDVTAYHVMQRERERFFPRVHQRSPPAEDCGFPVRIGFIRVQRRLPAHVEATSGMRWWERLSEIADSLPEIW